MRTSTAIFATGLAALALAGCGRKEVAEPVPGVAALQSDPILLSRVLERCNARPDAVGTQECINARAAVDRRSADGDAARAKKAEAGFEMAREARRRADEAARQSREALEKRMSPYELPVEGADDKPPPAPTGE